MERVKVLSQIYNLLKSYFSTKIEEIDKKLKELNEDKEKDEGIKKLETEKLLSKREELKQLSDEITKVLVDDTRRILPDVTDVYELLFDVRQILNEIKYQLSQLVSNSRSSKKR